MLNSSPLTDAEVEAIAAQAWNATKPNTDNPWESCDKKHREDYAYTALAIVKGGNAQTPFEQEVHRVFQSVLIDRANQPAPVEVVESLSDASDAPAHVREQIAAQDDAEKSAHSEPEPAPPAVLDVKATKKATTKRASKKKG